MYVRVIKDRHFIIILLCLVFAYLGVALPTMAQTKSENSGVYLDVIASVPIVNPTNEALAISVIVPAAFLLTESFAIDDDYDDPEFIATGFETPLSFFSSPSIQPVFTVLTEKKSGRTLAPQAPHPPPFM